MTDSRIMNPKLGPLSTTDINQEMAWPEWQPQVALKFWSHLSVKLRVCSKGGKRRNKRPNTEPLILGSHPQTKT